MMGRLGAKGKGGGLQWNLFLRIRKSSGRRRQATRATHQVNAGRGSQSDSRMPVRKAIESQNRGTAPQVFIGKDGFPHYNASLLCEINFSNLESKLEIRAGGGPFSAILTLIFSNLLPSLSNWSSGAASGSIDGFTRRRFKMI
jgi:hypothetical protein